MVGAEQKDSWWVWCGKLALYRVWRLRRGILVIALLPFAAFYAGTVFHPKLGPILFPNLSLTNPLPKLGDVHAYGMVLDGTLFFVLQPAVFALGFAILCPQSMARCALIFVLVGLVILLMPWAWPILNSLSGDKGIWGASFMALTAGILWAASAIWKSKRFNTIRLFDPFTVRTCIPVNGSLSKILDALKYERPHAEWDGLVKDVRDNPDIPGRRIIRYVTDAEAWLNIRPGRNDLEFVAEFRRPDIPGFVDAIRYRVHKRDHRVMLEVTERVEGWSLLPTICYWLDDAATDCLVYFRDRMEGRRSLSNKAALLRG